MQALLTSFKIDPSILLLNGILFLALVQIMDKLFWKPVLRHLDGRKASIENAYQAVDNVRREMEDLRSEYQSRLSQIESDARRRIQDTVRDAQRQREEMIAKARSEADATIKQGAARIGQEKGEMLVAMRDHLDEAAGVALAKVRSEERRVGKECRL